MEQSPNTTRYQICRCLVGWYQPDALAYARPVDPATLHRSLGAAARRMDRIQRECRSVNGPGSWVPVKILATDDRGRDHRYLTEDEKDSCPELSPREM